MPIGAIPMFRLLVALAAGIGYAGYAWPVLLNIEYLISTLWVVILSCFYWKNASSFLVFIRSSGIWLLFFFFGVFLFKTNAKTSADHWTSFGQKDQVYTACILKKITRESHSQLIITLNNSLDSTGSLFSVSGKALLLIPHEENISLPATGSLVGFRTTFSPIRKAMNPLVFDPSAYWKRQDIQQQAWVKAPQLVFLRPPKEGSIAFFRNQTLAILEKVLPEKDQLGIAVALVLGDKSLLDQKIKSSYSESGAIHVLAVSGLHVGLVYGMCLWVIDKMSLLLPFLRRFKLGLLLLSLLCYMAFTGASPSVCRAVVMLSCWIIGKALHKSPSIYNVICVSAFVLLLLDPGWLFDVGFQLSYSAVLSIISLYPIIVKCWTPQLLLVEYAWKLIGVSIAAQLGTLPWVLYYFHQFPTYFGLSSLLIIPIITAVLILTFLVLFFAWQSSLCMALGKILHFLIFCSNGVTHFIQELPWALLKDIWINELDICFYYAFLLILARLWRRFNLSVFAILLSLCMFWAVAHFSKNYDDHQTSNLVVYHTNGFFIADYFEKGYHLSFVDQAADSLQLQYTCGPWRSYKGVVEENTIKLPVEFSRSDTAINWIIGDEQLLLIGPFCRILPNNPYANSDKILIVDPDNRWPEYWMCLENIRMVVLLSGARSNNHWRQKSEEYNLPLWSIDQKGAFMYDF